MPSITINVPPGRVWEVLTTPALRKKWFFGVETTTDWREGSPIFHEGVWQGKPYQDKGYIKTFDPLKRLVHTHWSAVSGRPDKPENYETVSFALADRNGATEVVVKEENLASEEQRATSEELWQRALEEMKKVAEGQDNRSGRGAS
jgi:uncharacterized protein YndB with AHSA1/START domain